MMRERPHRAPNACVLLLQHLQCESARRVTGMGAPCPPRPGPCPPHCESAFPPTVCAACTPRCLLTYYLPPVRVWFGALTLNGEGVTSGLRRAAQSVATCLLRVRGRGRGQGQGLGSGSGLGVTGRVKGKG